MTEDSEVVREAAPDGDAEGTTPAEPKEDGQLEGESDLAKPGNLLGRGDSVCCGGMLRPMAALCGHLTRQPNRSKIGGLSSPLLRRWIP